MKEVHCITRRISTRKSAFIKCIIDKLLILEELNIRRPDIYLIAEYVKRNTSISDIMQRTKKSEKEFKK